MIAPPVCYYNKCIVWIFIFSYVYQRNVSIFIHNTAHYSNFCSVSVYFHAFHFFISPFSAWQHIYSCNMISIVTPHFDNHILFHQYAHMPGRNHVCKRSLLLLKNSSKDNGCMQNIINSIHHMRNCRYVFHISHLSP